MRMAEPELTLDELSAAYAEVLGRMDQPAGGGSADSAVETQVSRVGQTAVGVSAEVSDAACPIGPLTILEAMLFVGDPASGPLSYQRLAGVMRLTEQGEIHALVAQLNRRYTDAGCPYEVVHEGDGYRMTLRDEFKAVRERFYGKVREARLSQPAVDVLALVAYNQPIDGERVARLRGSPSGQVLAQLVRRRLLKIERPETAPRRAHYRTTRRFLEIFGLSGLEDLPVSQDLDQK